MRIGGDEFIVVMRDVKAENLEGLAKMLHNYITTPILTNDNLVKLKGSIGVASCPHDACTIDELMFCADAAMFNAKRNQTNYSFYNEKFSESYKRKLFIKSNILNSINNDHFYIVYQPIINARTLVISGVEALIRWNHPEEGDFYPSEFIPIAENNDSILKLGNWIIRKVCSDVERWREEGMEDLFVSINISPNQIEDPNFSKAVLDIIKEYTIDTSKIKFEITENVTITNFYNTNEVMKSFEDLNIEWFIDDFGSGYTSLSMIKHLSIDCLKIDKSYINDVNMCNSSSQIVTAIHSLSTGLGMEVISEGVETDSQFERLKKIGTDYVQGYFFSRPLTYDELVKQYKEGRFSPYKINKNQ